MKESSLDRKENLTSVEREAPMGPSRFLLSKPVKKQFQPMVSLSTFILSTPLVKVIGAIEGYAVAGGLELSLFCDMRIAARNTVFGVYCRRFGVPLIGNFIYFFSFILSLKLVLLELLS